MSAVVQAAVASPNLRPLVVDLDGTLIRSDLLIEAAVGTLVERPLKFIGAAGALLHGKAALKAFFAEHGAIEAALLPYDPVVISYIQEARASGRAVYLASAANQRLVERVAQHLGCFDGWFASDAEVNLAGHAKADVLARTFGERQFDYVADARADLPVWGKAASAITVREQAGVLGRLRRAGIPTERLASTWGGARAWLKLLRAHQYAKNVLVFVPLLTAHLFSPGAMLAALLAFVAFCLCASGIYIVNDAIDLADDRRHRSKRHRPLASGTVPIRDALLFAPLLLLAGSAIAAQVSGRFFAVLLGYLALTTAYSFYLKRKLMVDVITLATLYALRVIGGAVAIGTPLSEWLVAFCVMIFTSLALMKRYVELAARRDTAAAGPTRRNYRDGDLGIVATLAAVAAFNAVTVFALYVASDNVQRLYAQGWVLWLFLPLLIYWLSRALVLATRREMNDDPIVFALKDPVSLLTALCGILIVLLAM
jgi:4-hydroxybenzoate polyprenyltransferase